MIESTTIIRRVFFWFVFYSFTVLSIFAWVVFKIFVRSLYRDL